MRSTLIWLFIVSIPASALARDAASTLLSAAWSGQPAVVRSALASGRVDVDVARIDGSTALMLASLAGHETVVDILIDAGANPNLAGENGETALILASKYGFRAVAAKLIEAGADLSATDSSGRTAWTWAHWGENEPLESLLRASGADGTGKVDPFEDGGEPVDRFEKTPELEKYKAPKVPKQLKKNRVEGMIQIRLVIGRNGKPRDIELVQGVHEELDQNALAAAEKWRFVPGEVQGKPVDGIATVNIQYSRGDDPKGHVMLWTRRWRN